MKNLDDQCLIRSKEASRRIANHLEKERLVSIRIIKTYNKCFEGFEESWTQAMFKIPIDIAQELGIAVEKFFKKQPTG